MGLERNKYNPRPQLPHRQAERCFVAKQAKEGWAGQPALRGASLQSILAESGRSRKLGVGPEKTRRNAAHKLTGFGGEGGNGR